MLYVDMEVNGVPLKVEIGNTFNFCALLLFSHLRANKDQTNFHFLYKLLTDAPLQNSLYLYLH